jgi:hypothetical protein
VRLAVDLDTGAQVEGRAVGRQTSDACLQAGIAARGIVEGAAIAVDPVEIGLIDDLAVGIARIGRRVGVARNRR